MTDAIAWTLLAAAALLGLAGTVMPFLPGTPIILAGAVLHRLLLPDVLSWWTIAGLFLFAALAAFVEAAAAATGPRWMGASRWAVGGAIAGFLAGLFFGPPGWILGPILGALLAEMIFARKSIGAASRAGVGAGLGLAAAAAVRVAVAVAVIAALALDAFLVP